MSGRLLGSTAYIDKHGVHTLLDGIVAALLTEMPADPAGAIIELLRAEAEMRGVGRLLDSPASTPTEPEPLSSAPQRIAPPPPPLPSRLAPPALSPEAIEYTQRHRIAFVIEDWLQALVAEQPAEPLRWSVAFFAQLQQFRVQRAESASDVTPLPPPPPPPEPLRVGGGGGEAQRVPVAPPTRASSKPIAVATPQRFAKKPNPRILVVYYSTYRHGEALVFGAAEGARRVSSSVDVKRIPETLSAAQLEKMQAAVPNKDVPLANPLELQDYDGVVFCFPTRFGAAPAQVQTFMDATGPLWVGGLLVGKPAAVMVTTATQHGGQESTVVAFQRELLHHGMVLVGPTRPMLSGSADVRVVCGGSPYGASAAVGTRGERTASDEEVRVARELGERLAHVASNLASRPIS